PMTDHYSFCFGPSLDYVVIKIPRFTFDKFTTGDRHLGTQMKATGEIMAIGHNIEEALLKGIRTLEIGNRDLYLQYLENEEETNRLERIKNTNEERILIITELLRRSVTMETIHAWTKMDYLFIQRIQHIIELEKVIKEAGLSRPILEKVKKYGFSDIQIARVLGKSELDVYNYRMQETLMP